MLGIFAIKDVKTGAFWRPFTHVNDATASREFSNLVNSSRDDFIVQNYPDLSLYRIGTFDDQTGDVTSNVEFMLSGVDVKKVGE